MQVFFANKKIKYFVILIQAIAKRIHEVMMEKGMTQYALCKRIAISESSLYNICYNRQKDIPFGKLLLICEGLDISIQEFLNSPLFSKENLEID